MKAEYTADRAGLLACRSLEAAVSALVKVHFWGQELDVEKYLKRAEAALEDPMTQLSEYFSGRPYLSNRIGELRRFAGEMKLRDVL